MNHNNSIPDNIRMNPIFFSTLIRFQVMSGLSTTDAVGEKIQKPVRDYIDLYHGKMRGAGAAGPDDVVAFIWSRSLQNGKIIC